VSVSNFITQDILARILVMNSTCRCREMRPLHNACTVYAPICVQCALLQGKEAQTCWSNCFNLDSANFLAFSLAFSDMTFCFRASSRAETLRSMSFTADFSRHPLHSRHINCVHTVHESQDYHAHQKTVGIGPVSK